jgi:hypothetical protein
MAQMPWTHTKTRPKWRYGETLWSSVPWLKDSADLRAMGPAECAVELPDDLTLGLLIPDPFGKETAAVLSVHATKGNGNDGGTITLAITNVLAFDVKPKAPERSAMDLDLLSNPVRKPFPDDNGCEDVDD